MNVVPSRKTGIGALAGTVAVVLTWGIGAIWNVSIPPEVASAFTAICHFVVAWIVPSAEE